MTKIRKSYNSNLKLKIALKFLEGDMSCIEICNKYGLSKAAVYKWVRVLKKSATNIYDSKNKFFSEKTLEETQSLYEKIGQLQVERDFLKKALES